ncbi:MAG: hypothetical protein IJP78_05375 [Clostridia bacterium]|nr:hypothetical protein [Clostridia bacterium]
MNRLTEAQKTAIKEMRESGLGYKSIAKKLLLSRDTVRSFCVRNIASKTDAEHDSLPVDHERRREIKTGETTFVITTAYSETATETLEKKLEKLILDDAIRG